ncbi:MAG: hypothetical protein IPG07_06260 [Crocinitomicaceae bacterium]|nr:hypothetical protein [Crocinitomicaceae bacterium]
MPDHIKQKKAIQGVCDMYNKLDVKFLNGHTNRNLVYESQWVLTPIVGQRKTQNYLRKKFETLAKNNIKLDARILETNGIYPNQIMVIQGKVVTGIIFQMENNRISRIDIVDPSFLIEMSTD